MSITIWTVNFSPYHGKRIINSRAYNIFRNWLIKCWPTWVWFIFCFTWKKFSVATNTIISSITLDSFVTFQNGDLTTNFLNNENSALVDMAEYETMDQPPKIYSKLDKSNEKDIIFFKNAVSSFNSFKKFLQDKEELVENLMPHKSPNRRFWVSWHQIC
mgnify:CR=1 FL=1